MASLVLSLPYASTIDSTPGIMSGLLFYRVFVLRPVFGSVSRSQRPGPEPVNSAREHQPVRDLCHRAGTRGTLHHLDMRILSQEPSCAYESLQEIRLRPSGARLLYTISSSGLPIASIRRPGHATTLLVPQLGSNSIAQTTFNQSALLAYPPLYDSSSWTRARATVSTSLQ